MAEERQRDIVERTFRFSVRIVRVCQSLDEQLGVGRTLSSQLLRSGISIGANVEDAQAGQCRANFLSKYSIAPKKARGVKQRPVLEWFLLADSPRASGIGLARHRTEMADVPGTPYGQRLLVRPEPGLLVLFPGWMYHFVHPVTSTEPRISIAFNALWKRT